MDQNDGNLGGQPDIAADIDSILSGGTSQSDPTPGSALAPQQQGQHQQGYRFGGRSYQSQQEAEKAHNQLYGKYSEQQQLFNKLKSALKDPEAYRQFAQNPEWRDILGKLGVEEAEAEYEEAQAQESGGPEIQNLPPQLREAYKQIQIDRETFKLDREEASFEKKLGRPVSAEEHNAVMSIIVKADSLTYEEAFKLAFHDKLVREAAAKVAGQNQRKGNRPPPVPLNIPGVKMDLKKPVHSMSREERREAMRSDPDFQKMLE